MGLQVWLPLNGNLNNQGLTNIAFTNTGATVNNNGKIGSCYYFSSQSLYNTNFNWTSTNWSICYWVKYTSLPSGSNFYHITLNGSTSSDYTFMLGGVASSSTTGVFRCNMAGDCGTINTGIWYHVCATYNGASCKIYVNGTLLKTFNITVNTGKKHLVINGRANNTEGTSFVGTSSVCYLNDVRIYDNCLSDKEVKLISQGLILHYPLDRNGWGQDNLVTDTNFTSSSISSMAVSNAVNLGQWKRESSNVTLAMDGEYVKLHYETNTSRYGIHYEISLDPGTYTYSITAGGRMTCSFGLATSWPSTNIITANSPGRYSATFTVSETATYRMYIYTTSANPDIWFNWPKLEVGSRSTSWTPNSADVLYTTIGLGNNIEYDVSGYQNNGTRTGTFSWNIDSPKYGIGQVFSGNQYIVEPNEISTTDSTISLWIKSALAANCHVLDARNSSEIGKQPIYQYTNGSIQTGGNNKYVTTNTGLLTANTWIHVALVQAGDSLLVYKNGNLFQTISCTNSPIIKPTVGARLNFANKYTGQLSDVRIYATALSADDILELYNNKAI